MSYPDRFLPSRARGRALGFPLFAFAALSLAACDSPPVYSTPPGPSLGSGGILAPDMFTTAADGESCTADEDCDSGHCSNELCCQSGDCCQVPEDCLSGEDSVAMCEDEKDCQGARGAATCLAFRCRVREGGVDDDSACDKSIEADTCGLYISIFCTGEEDQDEPECPERCRADADCDPEAHCTAGKCVEDVPNGGDCMADNECASDNCNNAVCCADGDCCRTPEVCDPMIYSGGAACDDPAGCQGTHGVPACEDSKCVVGRTDDDSACNRTIIANDCGAAADVLCRGGVDQGPPPPCATGTCGGLFAAASCNEDAWCWEGECIPDQPNGEGCTDAASCQSANCQNNVCCSDGDCCENDAQCPPSRMCEDAGMCQGKRQDRVCDVEGGSCVNLGEPVDDDSGCAGMVAATECGLNPPARCSQAESQTTPPVTACTPCTTTPICPGTCMPSGPASCLTRIICDTANTDGTCTRWTTPVPCQPSSVLPVGCLPGATTCNLGVCR
jgi:hypothetical protein